MRVSPLGAQLCRSAAAALPLPTLQHAWLSSQWPPCCSSRGRHRPDVRTFSSSANANSAKKRVVFLGTPEVAALALKELLQASQVPSSTFEVAAVVSQPGKPKGRGNKAVPIPSPVEQLARSSGIADDRILCPKSAREASFLAALTDLQPDLCVTAAYGNMLPTAFLDIPKHGTLNIHPSLLPQYRGAAPVPRALQDGVSETGVSVAFTVLRCDAGPVLAQRRIQVLDDVQAPQLLEQLFALGSKLMVSVLDDVWAGQAAAKAWPQDESQATHAAKMSKEEGVLDFSQPARTLHNKVRAFAGWPGTTASFTIADDAAGRSETLVYKVLSTRVVDGSELQEMLREGEVAFSGSRMLVPCGDGTVLEVLQLQPPAKKAISARDFKNGLGKKRVLIPPPSAAASLPMTADTVTA